MKLLEYQGKELFAEYDIAIPKSYLAKNQIELSQIADKLKFPVVLKSQLTVGGRGKAGAILKCTKKQELESKLTELLNKEVKGERPKVILIEEAVDIDKELYLSLFLNRGKRTYSLISSPEGGMDIESVENKVIQDISITGLTQSITESIAKTLGLSGVTAESFSNIVIKLAKLVREKEAELAEINPLAIIKDGSCLALDAKIIIDDNSIFRHPELRKYIQISELQEQAEKSGFSFVELDGNIAIIGNGAGLVMSTLDIVNDAGGKAGAFLDFGGRATTETIYKALEVISKLSKVKAILVNLFGGIVRTDLVAQAILDAYRVGMISVPIYARISGAESDKSKQMLSNSNAKLYDTVEEAIASLVQFIGSNK
ncbi:MAG TPA: succinate--CoA ligase subunit beta [Nitrososphaeraceae archaeon]